MLPHTSSNEDGLEHQGVGLHQTLSPGLAYLRYAVRIWAIETSPLHQVVAPKLQAIIAELAQHAETGLLVLISEVFCHFEIIACRNNNGVLAAVTRGELHLKFVSSQVVDVDPGSQS